MGEKGKYLFKNMGILTISNFASKILVFLLVPLYTSVLSTAEYGTYDLVVSTVSLLFPILTMNIFDAIMRYCMDSQYSNDEIAIIGSKKVLMSILICGVSLLIIGVFKIFPQIEGLVLYIFAYYVSYVINQFLTQYAKGLEKVALMGIVGVIGTLMMLGGNILFLLVFKMGLTGFFVANILSQAVPAVIYFFSLRFWKSLSGFKTNKNLQKQMLVYCLPLLFTTLGWWVNNMSDRYVVTLFCGVAANGILSVSYKIPSIINTLQSIFIQAWQISAIKEYGENDTNSFYRRIFIGLNLCMTLSCGILIMVSKFLAHFLYSNDFYVAWKYVPFLMISTAINCTSGFIGPILAAKKDSKSMAISSIYGALTNLILNFILVYAIGIQGATIATMVSSYVIYHFRMKAVRNELIIENRWKQLVGWLLLIIQSVINIYLPNIYIEFVVIILVVVLNFDTVIKIKNYLSDILKKKRSKG